MLRHVLYAHTYVLYTDEYVHISPSNSKIPILGPLHRFGAKGRCRLRSVYLQLRSTLLTEFEGQSEAARCYRCCLIHHLLRSWNFCLENQRCWQASRSRTISASDSCLGKIEPQWLRRHVILPVQPLALWDSWYPKTPHPGSSPPQLPIHCWSDSRG